VKWGEASREEVCLPLYTQPGGMEGRSVGATAVALIRGAKGGGP
jgi:hypothetical protein